MQPERGANSRLAFAALKMYELCRETVAFSQGAAGGRPFVLGAGEPQKAE